MRTRIDRPSNVRGEPQRTRDQLAQTVLVPALDKHTIEHERRGNQAANAPRHALLSDLDAVVVSARERFEDRQLGLQQVRGAVLHPAECLNLSA
jgi:hypothetical protein